MAGSKFEFKLDRLHKGYKPRVLDLFSGCGGLSLGFKAADFEIVGAIELDEFAIRSHAENLFKSESRSIIEKHARPIDITAVEPAEYVKMHDLEGVESGIDFIVGGPPCQAFARVGRAKLREVAEHPQAFLKDPRSNLYLRFLSYVREFKPLAILMENVPDVLNFGGHNIAEETREVLSDLGYTANYTLLNSVFYGVPQMRERMFLIAYSKKLNLDIKFPEPSHWIDLPQGYNGSRMVALKYLHLPGNLFSDKFKENGFKQSPKSTCNLKPAVTAKEAIGDLPPITLHLENKLRRGARRFVEFIPYPENNKLNDYALLMRTWNGFNGNGGILDHVIRYLPRDYRIFRKMNPGDQYPQAYQHALKIFNEKLESTRANGQTIEDGSIEFEQLKKSIVPPYDPGKFPNKWRKMEADKPARTLMAHLGKDSYSHIHYDSNQARTISVREAARLQSFPDGFIFSGTMNPAFRQIGNAVPPLLSKAIAQQMYKDIKESLNGTKNSN